MCRTVAEESPNPPCAASQREDTGEPWSTYSWVNTARSRRVRSEEGLRRCVLCETACRGHHTRQYTAWLSEALTQTSLAELYSEPRDAGARLLERRLSWYERKKNDRDLTQLSRYTLSKESHEASPQTIPTRSAQPLLLPVDRCLGGFPRGPAQRRGRPCAGRCARVDLAVFHRDQSRPGYSPRSPGG